MKYTKTVRASKKVAPSTKRPIRANRKMVCSDEEIEDIEKEDIEIEDIDDEDFDDKDIEEDVGVEDEVEESFEEEILFEASDVAEVLAEVTGEPVDYTVDDETTEVTFTVGDDEITITPDGDEEVVEESTRVRGRKIAASKKMPRKVSASRRARR